MIKQIIIKQGDSINKFHVFELDTPHERWARSSISFLGKEQKTVTYPIKNPTNGLYHPLENGELRVKDFKNTGVVLNFLEFCDVLSDEDCNAQEMVRELDRVKETPLFTLIGDRNFEKVMGYINRDKYSIISKINSIENSSVFKKGVKKMWDIIYNYDKNN